MLRKAKGILAEVEFYFLRGKLGGRGSCLGGGEVMAQGRREQCLLTQSGKRRPNRRKEGTKGAS